MTATLTASALRRAVEISLESLKGSQELIDAANVFPVPDADTGTNLVTTFERVQAELAAVRSDVEVPKAVKTGVLRGAQGNSGAIVAQIVRAFADAVESGPVDGDGLARAFKAASEGASLAVLRPVAGTMLSVMAAASDAVQGSDADAGGRFLVAGDAATQALARTREQLPELQKAGVLDAGGMGLVLIINAFGLALGAKVPTRAATPGPEPEGVRLTGFLARAAEVAADVIGLPIPDLTAIARSTRARASGTSVPMHEVRYALRAPDETIEPLRAALDAMGENVEILSVGGLWRVKVDIDDERGAIGAGAMAGAVSDVHVTTSVEGATPVAEAPPVHGGPDATVAAPVVAVPPPVSLTTADVTFLAVASGVIAAELFSEIGVLTIEPAGQIDETVARLGAAVAAATTPRLILLPNDEDLFAAARVLTVGSPSVEVLRSTDLAEGFAVATAAHTTAPEHNRADLDDILARVRSGLVAHVPPTAHGLLGPNTQGSAAGFAEGEMVAAGVDPVEIALQVVHSLIRPSVERVIILSGEGVSDTDRRKLADAVAPLAPRARVDVHDAGQPRHFFLIAVL